MTESSTDEIFSKLRVALDLRKKYRYDTLQKGGVGNGKLAKLSYAWRDGIVHVHKPGSESSLFPVPSLDEFYDDMNTLFTIRSNGPVSSFCQQRLELLKTKFELYTMVSGDAESLEAMNTGHRDFYNVRKVDTHIHHSAAMNAKHLLRFMKKKLKTAGSDVVGMKDGKPRTLKHVFDDMNITWTDMCIDRLQVWADKTCLHRFDRFNNKYSPMGHNELRTIFLKTDNEMGGRYLAELTQELINDLEESKYQHCEWRLSIYGRKKSEWDVLSKWVLGEDGKGLGNRKALLSSNVRWMIQIPRLFSLYRTTGALDNFAQMLENIFEPMFEATLNPEAHPHVARFLENISGFDTVDDESKSPNPVDRTFSSKTRMPKEWDITENPSYKYYSYFIQSNLRVLNNLRQAKGMNTFSYRPHAGEAGEVHHLDTAFLLADGINHGINLRKSMGLQFLFYLSQIGIAMSPCSNNQLFLAYEKSPFPVYFARGLNVSLSTDDPLMFHYTKEPLMEEYSIAKQLWHFSAVDLCEMARNSVLQSGFTDDVKAAWLGSQNFIEDNVPISTNVPNLRLNFRQKVLKEEIQLVHGADVGVDDVGQMCNLLLMSPKSRQSQFLRDFGNLDKASPKANGKGSPMSKPNSLASFRLPSFSHTIEENDCLNNDVAEEVQYHADNLQLHRELSMTRTDSRQRLASSTTGKHLGDTTMVPEEWLRGLREELLNSGIANPRARGGLSIGMAAVAGAIGGAVLAACICLRKAHT
eukprot:TRINITY_DN4011_c1_g6_i1.p1 TRINITY_DN4011_c1_g6~~TRINITY_DN4011_c1_g6_i1.p1  ORF type:complete len:752 (+),score=141.80 TRINITY_DN4011_c1_g6_i1:64-2319(+)